MTHRSILIVPADPGEGRWTLVRDSQDFMPLGVLQRPLVATTSLFRAPPYPEKLDPVK
jgi:hypothetical protein